MTMSDTEDTAAAAAPSSFDGGLPAIPIAAAVAIPFSDPQSDAHLQSDEEAQATVDAARERGIATIRNHCEQHLSNNPDSTFVTWIATLHPENAQVTIDSRFLIPDNPWLTVWSEAREEMQKKRPVISSVAVFPTAPTDTSTNTPAAKNHGHDANDSGRKCEGSLLDFLIGNMLLLLSILSCFAFEMAAAYCYISYWLCSKIVEICSPGNLFTWLPSSIAYCIAKLFQLLDNMILFVGIIFIESIAVANWVTCTILALSVERGKAMHQVTRKMSHHVRWAFRQKFASWDPPRRNIFICDENSTVQEAQNLSE